MPISASIVKKKKNGIVDRPANGRIPTMAFWLWAAAVLVLDRASKIIVARRLTPGNTLPLWRGRFHITYVRNPGGAFGFLPGGRGFFLLASIIAITAIIAYKSGRRSQSALADLALALILGGSIGNLVDRLLYGEVIDWLDFRFWPVFNIADMALVIGLSLFALEIIRSHKSV